MAKLRSRVRWGRLLRLVVLVLAIGASAGPVTMAASAGEDAAGRHRQLLRRAELDFSRGAYQDGLDAVREALSLAKASKDPLRIATAQVVRANILLALGDAPAAVADLESVLDRAEAIDSPELVLSARNNLANARITLGDRAAAAELYTEVFEQANAMEGSGAKEIAARALVNRMRVQVDAGEGLSQAEISGVAEAIRGLPRSAGRAMLLIHSAGSYLRLVEEKRGDPGPLAKAGDAALREALALADVVGDPEAAPRIRAQALGYLGGFYAEAGRDREALSLTRRAILQTARSGVEPDLYRWHRQSAHLHTRLGLRDRALDDYAASLRALEANRAAIARNLAQSMAPGEQSADLSRVYRDYVDLLLRRARDAESEDARRIDLETAQKTLERLKGDELRDYFEDDCVTRYREKLKSVTAAAHSALVVYPVLLEDRLELLVSANDELIQVVVEVERGSIRAAAERFRQLLEKRTTRQYLRPAMQLHRWLIDPIQPLLDRYQPDTLVFVPDGILRTVPMAALHDGEKFLIERYALGLTPGLEMTDPRPFDRENRLALVAGVSDGVQGFEPLPSVEREIDSVHEILGGDRLFNRGFSRAALTDKIREKNFGLIHIASHAQFNETVDGGFMLAHDGRISFDALADAVGAARYREDPLELVILSACETADGNERAALGLSGIAVKAGARSALGTLWQVSDEATAEFMIRFYESLGKAGTSRAQAVRDGQVRLIEDPVYSHPYYWSPFLLINSWL